MVETIYRDIAPKVVPIRDETVSPAYQDFVKWLKNSKRGEKYCYHIGAHASGNTLARLAFRAYQDDFVILFQRRESKGFSYWAQRR